MRPKLDTLLNGLLAIACVAVTALAIQRFLAPERPGRQTPQGYLVGDPFPRIDGIDFSSTEQTLVMVLASTCRYCTESAPFYADLVKKRDPRKLRLLAVGSEPAHVLREYLQRYGIDVDLVANVAPGEVKATATPTLLLLDRSGQVRAQWIGALRGREGEVETRVLAQGS